MRFFGFGWFALVAMLLMTVACAGGRSSKNEALAHYKMGLSYMNTNDRQAAFLEFQKSLQLNPDDKEVYVALGIVYLQLEDPQSAEKVFRKSVSIDSDYSEGYNNLCYVYLRLDDFEKAARNCLKAIENPLYPTPDKAYYNLGMAYYRLGRHSDAILAFLSATRRVPNIASYYYGLALALNAMGQYGKASEAMTKGVNHDARFKGDRKKAEMEFKNDSLDPKLSKDMVDFVEILKY